MKKTNSQAEWAVILSLMLSVTAMDAHAGIESAVSVVSEFQVNTYTTGAQRYPAVARDAVSGEFVVVWEGASDGANFGIFGQRFGNRGTPLGGQFQVNTYTTSEQSEVDIASGPDGGFVVAWTSYGQDRSNRGVFGQRYDGAGVPIGSEFQVNSYTTGNQRFPAVDIDGLGNIVVAWEDWAQDGSGTGVFARRYDSQGGPLGTEFQVNTYTTSTQDAADVAAWPNGDFAVVWHGLFDGSNFGVFGQRFASQGSPFGAAFQVNTYTTGQQSQPSITTDDCGGFVVAWSSNGQDGDGFGTFVRRFTSSAEPLGSEFQVNQFTTANQFRPDVALDGSGAFVVTQQSEQQDGAERGVFARLFDSSGQVVGEEFQVNSYTTGFQRDPRVAADSTGDFLIVWASEQDGWFEGIFAQRYEAVVPADPCVPPPTYTPPDTESPTLTATASATVTTTATSSATATETPTPTATATRTATATFTATNTPALAFCPTTPRAGCATPGKSLLKMRETGDPAKRSVLWKWLKGDVAPGAFGDPAGGTTNYGLCLYADDTLVLSPAIESGTHWAAAGTGFKYLDPSSSAGGIFKVLLKEGAPNGRVLVKARGANLAAPPLPIAPATSVRVQLVKNPGAGPECWEAQFDAPFVKDASGRLKAKLP